MRPMIARVALPVPLDKQFDYKIPSHLFPIIGGRVSVPFGRQTLTGIVTALVNESEFELDKLKPIKALLDNQPVWPESVYSLLVWCSQFYQYPLGETLANALPSALRKGKAADFATLVEWQLTPSGRDQLMQGFGRAVKQAKVMHMLEHGAVPHQEFIDEEVGSAVLKTLEEKGWIESVEKNRSASHGQWNSKTTKTSQSSMQNKRSRLRQ